MAKAKVKKEEKTDLQVRQEGFIKEMEALEIKYKLKVACKMLYAEEGIVPRVILRDEKDEETK